MLTGDPSAIAAARSIADHYGAAYINHYDFTNGRVPGWHLLLTLAVYRATCDLFYLNAARIMVDRVMERRTPGSGWARQMVPGHCHCTPRCRGACSFMQGVLGCGLREYYLETKDPRVPAAVVDAARYVIEQMWVDDRTAFRYTSCPESSITTSRTDTLAGLLCFAHELSGDRLFADVLVRGMAENMKRTHSITHLRWLPYVTHYLDRLKRQQLGVGGEKEVILRLKADSKEPFEVRLFDRQGKAAPQEAAELIAFDGTRLRPGAHGRIRVQAARPGIYRLRIAPGRGPWLVDTTLRSAVLPLRGMGHDIDLEAGPDVGRLYFHPPTAGELRLVFYVLEGHLRAALYSPSGDLLAKAERGKGRLMLSVKSGTIPLHELRLSGPARFRLAASGARWPWAALSPSTFFNASVPTVTIQGNTNLRPGQGRTVKLRAQVEDPEDDVISLRWELPGGKAVEAPELTYEAGDRDEFEIKTVATDRAGHKGRASVHVRVPPVALADAGKVILVQAEDFAGQGVGKVRVYTRVGCMGKMITYWHTELGHWLEWKVAVPKPGDYVIYARYATDCDNSRRSLTVDGKSPGPPYDSIQFARTGGYCTVSDNWATKKLGPAIKLTAGEHTVRMTNLGDGLALDYVAIAKAR